MFLKVSLSAVLSAGCFLLLRDFSGVVSHLGVQGCHNTLFLSNSNLSRVIFLILDFLFPILLEKFQADQMFSTLQKLRARVWIR